MGHLTNMSAVYEVWIKKTHKETWSLMLYASVLATFWTILGVLPGQSPVKIYVLGPSKCYGFEQQQRSSAQVASRSRNRTAVCE